MTVLPETAEHAWHAYEEMLGSKTAHFSYLQQLEDKYRHGGQRSLAEGAHLNQLLAAHDARVKAFRLAITELSQLDLSAHQTLIEHIAALNADPDADIGQGRNH